jgi:hypothetical protein
MDEKEDPMIVETKKEAPGIATSPLIFAFNLAESARESAKLSTIKIHHK